MYRVLLLRGLAAIVGWSVAKKKGRDPFLWAVLSFILPPLALLVMVLRPKLAEGRTKLCPNCSKVVYKDDTVCRHCERDLPIDMVRCPHCGNFVQDRDYCMQCSKKMKG